MASRLPEVSARLPGVAIRGPQPVAPEGIAVAAEGVRQLGQTLFANQQRIIEERTRREKVNHLAGVQSRINAFREQAFLSQDPDELDRLVNEELPKIREEAHAGFPAGDEEYHLDLDGAIDRARASLTGHRLAVYRNDSFATSRRVGEVFAEDAAQIPLDDVGAHEDAVAQMRQSIESLDFLTPGEREEAIGRAGRNGALTFIGRDIEENPRRVRDLFSDPSQVENLEADPLLSFLTPADREKIAAQAAQTLDAQQARSRQLAASNLEIAVEEGRGSEDAIQAAFDGEIISGPKRTELILRHRKLAAEGLALEDAAVRYSAVVAGEDAYDPGSRADQKEVDSIYEGFVAPRIEESLIEQAAAEGMTSGQVQNLRSTLQSRFVAAAGIVPESLVRDTQAALLNGPTERAVQAADLMDKLAVARPYAMRRFGKEAREAGAHLTQMTRAGRPAAEAVEDMRKGLRRSPAETDVLRRAYRDQSADNLSWLASTTDRWFQADPETLPPQMQGEFDALVEDSYLRTGDIESARLAAQRDLLSVWGRTHVNGEPEWMKYAPEVFYGEGAWIRDQLIDDVAKRLGEDISEESLGLAELGGGEFSREQRRQAFAERIPLKITTTPATAREAAIGRPSYTVLTPDEKTGEWVPLFERWVPDLASSQHGQELRAEREKSREKARERRALVQQVQTDPRRTTDLGPFIEGGR